MIGGRVSIQMTLTHISMLDIKASTTKLEISLMHSKKRLGKRFIRIKNQQKVVQELKLMLMMKKQRIFNSRLNKFSSLEDTHPEANRTRKSSLQAAKPRRNLSLKTSFSMGLQILSSQYLSRCPVAIWYWKKMSKILKRLGKPISSKRESLRGLKRTLSILERP